METWWQDVRFALRQLRRSPGFCIVTVLTLALGIGVNAAIFSVVDAVLFRALPYRDADRLVKIAPGNLGVGLREIPLSVPELDDLRARGGVFEEVSAVWPISVNLTGADRPLRLELLAVTPNYFSMLGVEAALGRVFDGRDAASGFAEAAVISDGLWHRAFGGDPQILGRTLRMDTDLYSIVGVLPPGFRHPGRTIASEVDVWATAGFASDPFPKPTRNIRLLPGAIGRLKSDVTLEQARARLAAFASDLRREYPNDYPEGSGWSVEVRPLKDSLVGDVQSLLLVLLGAVILIVLIASVNVASLLLARASTRQREIATRLALGASRARVIRQMLTESTILIAAASLTGLVAANATLDLVVRWLPARIPRLSEVRVDGDVLGFALLITIATGIVCGLVPALQASKADLIGSIREGGAGSGQGRETTRLRAWLTVGELALAVVLMIGSGLLIRTFVYLLTENPGFNPAQVVSANVWLPVPNDPRADPYAKVADRSTFVRSVLTRLERLPGVELAGMTTALPVTAASNRTALIIENQPVESSRDLTAEVSAITPSYLAVMQIPLVRGRGFDAHDDATALNVALVDETTARRFWPGEDPLGRRLRFGRAAVVPWLTVVGIVKDVKHDGLDAGPVPHLYVPMYQRPGRAFAIVARTRLAASGIGQQVTREVQSVDPGLPVFAVRSLDEVIDASLAPRRFAAQLVALFAALALSLASVGIYGLLAYVVGQRTREIGVRMALGARTQEVRGLIVGRGMRLSAIGVAIGVALSAAAAPLMTTLLYGVRPIDPYVFLAVPLLFIVIASVASYLPAQRATKVDVIAALRD